MIAMLSFGIWARLAGIALLTLVTSFVIKLYANRQTARRLIKAGVVSRHANILSGRMKNNSNQDMPPDHSFLFGHLAVADEVMKSLPPFTTFDIGFGKLGREKFPNGIFMLDLWPFDYRLFIISSPQIAVQVEKHNMVLKPDDIIKSFDLLATGPTLITMDEKRWKPWRKLFSPSFSPSYVLELAPGIATEAHVFVSKLRERSHYGKVFELEKLTANLALDVIGRAGM
jgi:cytochrome P450